MAEIIHGDLVYVNLDEVIETVYQCRAAPANDEWEKRWLEPLENLPRIEAGVDAISREMVSKRLAELWETEHPEKSYDKWLKIASEWCDYFPSVIPKRSCYRCGLREDCEDSTERKPKEGEWIPCSEKLPEKDGSYLVYMSWNYRSMDVLMWSDGWNCTRRINGEVNRESEMDEEIIIAWMPLPKPWKGASR